MYEEIKTACLYLRYSSSNQTEQSIEGQMHVCQDFCKRHNIRIVEMYIDRATSASKDIEKRVEFLKMIKDSEKGNFNAVIVYKLDRFARSRYDSATYKYRLKRNGVQLISATENITQDPEGIILESVLEGMAEFYSAELSQKINRGMRESAMKHNSIGGAIPLGYKTVDKKLVIDETTAPIVREAFQMYADGESVAEICRTFNNRGYKTSKGTRFGKSSFTKIFRNEKYIGVYKYHDYRAEDVIPPIIDKDLWDRVQVRVGKIKKAPARNKARHTYLLTGKLFCGHCGSAMNADGNSQGYLYYRCYGKKNLDKQCNKRNMEKNLIERLVAQDAMSFLTDEYIEKIATIACDRNKQEIESDSPIPVIRDRIRQVDVSLNNLLKAIESGSAPDMLVKRMGELETEKKDMEVQLKKEMAHQVYIDKEQVIFWLEKFREGDINDEEFCQTVIDLFVNSVTVWDEPDDKFKITIAYNLTSIPQKTYRLSKDGRLSDYASNTPKKNNSAMNLHFSAVSFCTLYSFLSLFRFFYTFRYQHPVSRRRFLWHNARFLPHFYLFFCFFCLSRSRIKPGNCIDSVAKACNPCAHSVHLAVINQRSRLIPADGGSRQLIGKRADVLFRFCRIVRHHLFEVVLFIETFQISHLRTARSINRFCPGDAEFVECIKVRVDVTYLPDIIPDALCAVCIAAATSLNRHVCHAAQHGIGAETGSVFFQRGTIFV